MSYDFPAYGKLNIKSLSAAFNNTSASYKYVFFLSLLHLINDNPARREFSYKEIEVEMVYIGWYPHTFYKLNFGTTDKLAGVIGNIGDIDTGNRDKRAIKDFIAGKIDPKESTLLNMVPYRFLSVFVKDSSIDKTKDKNIVNWANSLMDSPNSLYSFKSDSVGKSNNSIILSSPWVNYIKENYKILHDFATFNFLSYMEKRNPNVLNLASKLFPPTGESRNLTTAKDFWLSISDDNNIRCIYTGDRLDKDNISIDHYLPWSFTAHNREWNLLPTSKEVNSSKSNKLPHKRYYSDFINLQYKALNLTRGIKSRSKYLESYIADLRIDINNLSVNDLTTRYNSVYKPLFTMAENQGFETGWEYNKYEPTPSFGA